MIYDLFTGAQWFVIWVTVWLIASVSIEIWMYRDIPWYRRRGDDPPPVLGGAVMGLAATLVLAGILGAIHGLTWMWIYG